MLANCGANTRRLVWSDYVLHITMPIELCITYPEMWAFAHTRLAIVSGPLMPCWETTLYWFFIRCTSSSNFFIRLLQMSNAFYKSSFCLNYYSTLLYGGDRLQQLFVSFSVFASHQYCFCVVKICGHCVHTKHKKSKKCFAPHKVEHVLTPVVWCATVWYPFSMLLRMTIQLWWG